MEIALIVAFAIYLGILITIGFIFHLKTKKVDEFMVGDRSVNYFVTAISAQASDMGAWLFLGFPGTLYVTGLIEAWTAVGLVIGMYLNWEFIAPKLRTMTEQLQTPTFSSFFNKRFNDPSGLVAVVSALITLIFFTFYIASGLVGMGIVFESAFGMNYQTGIILALGAALLFTIVGGFIAVAWCNLFQGLFLLVMIVMVPAYAFFKLPAGFASIAAGAAAKNVSLSLLPSWAALGNALILSLGWGLGYFGQPHILINFIGIDDVKKIKYAKYVGITWQIIVLLAAIFLGLISIGYFTNGISNPEMSFVIITKELFTPLLAGFAYCGILAATLSSMDSHILVSASTLAEDIYKRIFNKEASQKQIVRASQFGGLLVAAVALSISLNNSKTVYNLVNYAWSGLGSSFGPLMILSLYWNGVNRYGALAGLLTGSIIAGFWQFTGIAILPLIPGFIGSFIAAYVVSKITR